MPLYVSDYLGDTEHLSAAEHGAYLLLTMQYWQRGFLPNEDERLARIAAGMPIEDWRKMRPTIQAFFHTGWKHERIDFELKKSEEKAKSGRRGGSKTQANRKQTSSEPESRPPSETEALLPQPLKKIGGGGDAGATPLISEEAGEIAEVVAGICGLPEPKHWPPGWCGSPMYVQKWINGGYQREIIISACRAAMASKRDGAPDTIRYFEKAVARAHAQFSAPLPSVIQANPEQISGNSGNKWPANSIKGAVAKLQNDFAREGVDIEDNPPMRDITPASAGRG